MESFFALMQKNVLDRQRGAHGQNYAWRSSPGSSGPTTESAGNAGWER